MGREKQCFRYRTMVSFLRIHKNSPKVLASVQAMGVFRESVQKLNKAS